MHTLIKKTLILAGCLTGGHLFGQDHAPSPFESYSGFLTAIQGEPNADSAIYHLQNLAASPEASGMMETIVHNFFAPAFVDPVLTSQNDNQQLKQRAAQREFSQKLLARIQADTSQRISVVFAPLYTLNRIQQAGHDESAVSKLAADFEKEQMNSGDLYTNRKGRYALLIVTELNKYPALKAQADQLYQNTVSKLKENQIEAAAVNSYAQRNTRAWYRYLYAYAHVMPAAPGGQGAKEKEMRLKIANDFSPDLTDRSRGSSAYFYDAVMLQGQFNETFQDEYYEHLKNNGGDTETMLPLLTQLTLDKPGHKSELQKLYATSKSGTRPFAEYWTEQVNSRGLKAPEIALIKTDRQTFKSAELTGKWILVDFWGTWCGPCREEHPDLQNFYKNTISKKGSNIALLTVACRDTEPKVLKYMSDKNFSFPVAMADKDIVKSFEVKGYPTKVLITPQGNYITVPFGIDWQEFVTAYASL